MTVQPRRRLDVSADLVSRARRYSDEQLEEIRKSGDRTNTERELAACLLAALKLERETADVLEARDGELDRLEESINGMVKRIERHGAGAGGTVLKVAPATRFSPHSLETTEEHVQVDVSFLMPVDDVAPAFQAFADGALWLCGVAGGDHG